jgi:hypothetical protein
VSGDQLHVVATAAFSFPSDRFFDLGERLFELVFLVLWIAFVAFLAFSAVRVVGENARRKAKNRGKRRDRSASPARG